MASATWTKATEGNPATFSRNQTREDLEGSAITYDDASTDYDSITVYYDGYNPTTSTPEGEAGALWNKVAE